MNERTSVISLAGDYEESIGQLAKHLGTSKLRRLIFNTIYGRARKARSKKQLMSDANIRNKGNVAQQVQNELDYLSKHHLIVRRENAGTVSDGSRFVYQKDPSVRANKEQIIRLADNKKARERLPTKRRPIVHVSVAAPRVTRQALRKRKRLTVLYLIANPDPVNPLRVDAEVRKVQEAIRASAYRDNITVEYRPAANLASLIDGLNDHRPQIVHFSGHSSKSGGLVTDTGKINKSAISELSFELFAKALAATDHPPQIIVLNSCESSAARKFVLRAAKVVVSMKVPVTDIAATAFAQRFYAAIASGQSIKAAFAQGRIAVQHVSISEVATPELFHTADSKPEKMILT